MAVDTTLHGKVFFFFLFSKRYITSIFGSWCISTQRVSVFLLKEKHWMVEKCCYSRVVTCSWVAQIQKAYSQHLVDSCVCQLCTVRISLYYKVFAENDCTVVTLVLFYIRLFNPILVHFKNFCSSFPCLLVYFSLKCVHYTTAETVNSNLN